MPKFYLLDKMSFVYRAYHAAAHQSIRMTTKAGFPTGATYIFARMLKKLMDDHKPEYMFACLEGGGTFRDQLYPEYKANRKGEKPQELEVQFPYIDRILAAWRIPSLRVEGYEADDIIGTLSKDLYNRFPDAQIYCVTGDKDMYQLVNDRVFVLNPMKDLLADPQKVELIVGVPPALVTDVMALRGDTVDNVPGAPGIGDKSSVAIIKQFGSLTAALDRAGEWTKKKQRETLQTYRAQIELSHKLVTINCDIPDAMGAELPALGEPNKEKLKALYAELEFSSLLGKEQLAAVEGFAEVVQPEPPKQTDTRTTLDEETQDKLIDSLF